MHDHLCNLVDDTAASGNRARAAADRRRADDLFRLAMRDPGDGTPTDIAKRVGCFRSWIFWAGVSFGRYWKFFKIRAFLLTAQVLLGVFALYIAVGILPSSWFTGLFPGDWGDSEATYLGVFGLLSVAAVGWGRDKLLPLIGLYVGPIVLPVLAVTFIAQLMLALPDLLKHVFDTDHEPHANFGPTLTRR